MGTCWWDHQSQLSFISCVIVAMLDLETVVKIQVLNVQSQPGKCWLLNYTIFSSLIIQGESHTLFAGNSMQVWGMWRQAQRATCFLFSLRVQFPFSPPTQFSILDCPITTALFLWLFFHTVGLFLEWSNRIPFENCPSTEAVFILGVKLPLIQPQPAFLLRLPLPCVLTHHANKPAGFPLSALHKIPKVYDILSPSSNPTCPSRPAPISSPPTASACAQISTWNRNKGHWIIYQIY